MEFNREQAKALLEWAGARNPGPWVAHSLHTARAAETIARRCGMDPERAWVLGALHDIGRFEGFRYMHHIVAGFRLMTEKGDPGAARICMTHSFPGGDPMTYSGKWDVDEEERRFVLEYVGGCEMDDRDRLIQLCDAMCMAEGVCLIEKRLFDVGLRYGVEPNVVGKWRATMEIREDFERRMGASVYSLFPEAAANTMG